MVISKDIEWMRPYIELAKSIVPKIEYVRRVSSRKVSYNRKQLIHGIIHYVDKKHYKICLYTNYKDRATGVITDHSTISLLSTLAHELSHLEDFEHTPDRMKLECKIASKFMTKLKKDGYISEEAEFKDKKFFYKGE